ncbi:MAG: MgtC/SapB family protein [Leptospirales bacterium]|nr:MgtC/SapB family protein [Leptospirales bacterium]
MEFLGIDAAFGEIILRLSVSALCGLFIGLERGYRGKPAGVRTNLLIGLGACLFMLVSEKVAYAAKADGFPGPDPARIAAQVVTGIGFLGAGAILRNRGVVTGLTTAASIWCVSAIGLCAGAGMFKLSIFATIGIVFTLEFFTYFERKMRVRRFRYVRLEVVIKKEARVQEIRRVLRNAKVQFFDEETRKVLGETHYTTTLYFRGDVEKKIAEEIDHLPGVRDIIMLAQGVE